MWGMNASDAEAFKESPYTLVLTLKDDGMGVMAEYLTEGHCKPPCSKYTSNGDDGKGDDADRCADDDLYSAGHPENLSCKQARRLLLWSSPQPGGRLVQL